MDTVTYKPIAQLHCSNTSPYEAPRQGSLAEQSVGYIELNKDISADAYKDLESFSHIWLIYDFHEAAGWKPKVRPPRGAEFKRSVFATRSPYRPNAIGMSCVRLIRIENNKIFISHHDLLNKTPILDIKPYLAYADSFPKASLGWLNDLQKYNVNFSSQALKKLEWLSSKLDKPVQQTLVRQLEYDPATSKAKRIKKNDEHFIFSIKTWRFLYTIKENEVDIYDVKSGYSKDELSHLEDPHNDKELHKDFLTEFTVI